MLFDNVIPSPDEACKNIETVKNHKAEQQPSTESLVKFLSEKEVRLFKLGG